MKYYSNFVVRLFVQKSRVAHLHKTSRNWCRRRGKSRNNARWRLNSWHARWRENSREKDEDVRHGRKKQTARYIKTDEAREMTIGGKCPFEMYGNLYLFLEKALISHLGNFLIIVRESALYHFQGHVLILKCILSLIYKPLHFFTMFLLLFKMNH